MKEQFGIRIKFLFNDVNISNTAEVIIAGIFKPFGTWQNTEYIKMIKKEKGIFYHSILVDEAQDIYFKFIVDGTWQNPAEKNVCNVEYLLEDDNYNGLNAKISKNTIQKYLCRNLKEEIESDIFFEDIEVTVMSTMSSGKSTLLNALIGKNLIPAKNEPCTAKLLKIIDNDKMDIFKGFALNSKNEKEICYEINEDILSKWNSDEEIKYISIEGNLKGIDNTKSKRIAFIDTPGPNNSRDSMHNAITNDIIQKEKFNVILYVLNVTQLGVEDDRTIIDAISKKLSNNKDKESKIIFVLNKIDAIDTEIDGKISIVIENTRKYLEKNNISNPRIIPISSYAAKLFKMALDDLKMSEKERYDFNKNYDIFSEEDYNMLEYFDMEDEVKQKIYNLQSEYKGIFTLKLRRENINFEKRFIWERLKRTGIMSLEEIFNQLLVKN